MNLSCKVLKEYEVFIREFLDLFGFKSCYEAYRFIDEKSMKSIKYYEKALADYSIISEVIVNHIIPKDRVTEVKQNLKHWLLKLHKTVDPTIPDTTVLLINYYYGLYIAWADFILLTNTDLYNQKELLSRLIYMFYVKRFLSKLRSSLKSIRKDVMDRAILSLRASHNFRKHATINEAIWNDSIRYSMKLFEAFYKEKRYKYMHTFWSSTLHPKINTYAVTLKDRYIKLALQSNVSQVDYNVEEKTKLDKYQHFIHTFILEKEPIEELVDFVLYAANKQVSKETFVKVLHRIHRLNKEEIEKMLLSLLEKLSLDHIEYSDIIKEKLKEKSRVLYFPLKDLNYSLQTISNLKFMTYLYIIAYIVRDIHSQIQDISEELW